AVSLPRPMKTCFGRSLFCDACEALSLDAAGARLRCALATKPGEPAASTQASAKSRVARAFSRISFRIREQGFRGMAKFRDERCGLPRGRHYAIRRPTCHQTIPRPFKVNPRPGRALQRRPPRVA